MKKPQRGSCVLREFPETCGSEGGMPYGVQEPFHKGSALGKGRRCGLAVDAEFLCVSKEKTATIIPIRPLHGKSMGAKIHRVKATSLSMISQPDEYTPVILEEAAGHRTSYRPPPGGGGVLTPAS